MLSTSDVSAPSDSVIVQWDSGDRSTIPPSGALAMATRTAASAQSPTGGAGVAVANDLRLRQQIDAPVSHNRRRQPLMDHAHVVRGRAEKRKCDGGLEQHRVDGRLGRFQVGRIDRRLGLERSDERDAVPRHAREHPAGSSRRRQRHGRSRTIEHEIARADEWRCA